LEITKSNVEGKMKKIENLELKLITLREEENKNKKQSHAHTIASKEGKIQKLVGTKGLFASSSSTILKKVIND
jgi:hypothetical protein